MKQLLILLLISLGLIGSANANSIKGAFGYELGQVVKDAKIYGGNDPFSWFKSETDFKPKKPLPMIQNYQFSNSVISKRIFQIRGSSYLDLSEKPLPYFNCHSRLGNFGKLLKMLEAKYEDFVSIEVKEDKIEPLVHYYERYEFKDGNRKISLSCSDIKNGDYSLGLYYTDLKLRKKADEEEDQMIRNSTPDYDI